MLEQGHDEMQIDLSHCASLGFSQIGDLWDNGHKHFLAFVHRFGEAGTIGQMDCLYSYWTTRKPEGFRRNTSSPRCATSCRCWGSRSNLHRKSTSRARSAGSISGATPPSR